MISYSKVTVENLETGQQYRRNVTHLKKKVSDEAECDILNDNSNTRTQNPPSSPFRGFDTDADNSHLKNYLLYEEE